MNYPLSVLDNERVCGIRAKGYNYLFDKRTGASLRWGHTQEDDPFMAPVPELADISISNQCDRGCSFCYRDSIPEGDVMSLDTFKFLMDQLPYTFQLALGGGEPTMHPNFIEILKESHVRGKVPNYTTNGIMLTSEIIEASKKYCGAVAVSWSEVASEAIGRFIAAGVKTNLHYVVSTDAIDTALSMLDNPESFGLDRINAIVFLLHKGIGRADPKNTPSPQQTQRFILKAFERQVPVAFDACFVPHLAEAEEKTELELPWHLLDYCDGARFTIYVDEHLNTKPCSFCSGDLYQESLRTSTFSDIWYGEKFELFRSHLMEFPKYCPALSRCGTCS